MDVCVISSGSESESDIVIFISDNEEQHLSTMATRYEIGKVTARAVENISKNSGSETEDKFEQTFGPSPLNSLVLNSGHNIDSESDEVFQRDLSIAKQLSLQTSCTQNHNCIGKNLDDFYIDSFRGLGLSCSGLTNIDGNHCFKTMTESSKTQSRWATNKRQMKPDKTWSRIKSEKEIQKCRSPGKHQELEKKSPVTIDSEVEFSEDEFSDDLPDLEVAPVAVVDQQHGETVCHIKPKIGLLDLKQLEKPFPSHSLSTFTQTFSDSNTIKRSVTEINGQTKSSSPLIINIEKLQAAPQDCSDNKFLPIGTLEMSSDTDSLESPVKDEEIDSNVKLLQCPVVLTNINENSAISPSLSTNCCQLVNENPQILVDTRTKKDEKKIPEIDWRSCMTPTKKAKLSRIIQNEMRKNSSSPLCSADSNSLQDLLKLNNNVKTSENRHFLDSLSYESDTEEIPKSSPIAVPKPNQPASHSKSSQSAKNCHTKISENFFLSEPSEKVYVLGCNEREDNRRTYETYNVQNKVRNHLYSSEALNLTLLKLGTGKTDRHRHSSHPEMCSSCQHHHKHTSSKCERKHSSMSERKYSTNGERKHSSGSDKKHSSGSDRKHSSGSDKKHSSGSDRKHSSGSDRKHSSGSDRKHSSGSDRKHSSGSDRKHSSRSDRKHSSGSDRKHSSGCESKHSSGSGKKHLSHYDRKHSSNSESRHSATSDKQRLHSSNTNFVSHEKHDSTEIEKIMPLSVVELKGKLKSSSPDSSKYTNESCTNMKKRELDHHSNFQNHTSSSKIRDSLVSECKKRKRSLSTSDSESSFRPCSKSNEEANTSSPNCNPRKHRHTSSSSKQEHNTKQPLLEKLTHHVSSYDSERTQKSYVNKKLQFDARMSASNDHRHFANSSCNKSASRSVSWEISAKGQTSLRSDQEKKRILGDDISEKTLKRENCILGHGDLQACNCDSGGVDDKVKSELQHQKRRRRKQSRSVYVKKVSDIRSFFTSTRKNKNYAENFIRNICSHDIPQYPVDVGRHAYDFTKYQINTIDGCFEEGLDFLNHAITFINDFSGKYRPSPAILDRLVDFGLRQTDKLYLVFKSFHTLLYINKRHPGSITVDWKLISETMASIDSGRNITSHSVLTLVRASLCLQLAISSLKDDLFSRDISDPKLIRQSMAYKILSYDASSPNLKQIVTWLSMTLTSGEFEEVRESYLRLHLEDYSADKETENDCPNIEINLFSTEVRKILPMLQKLLELGIQVSSSNIDASKFIASEVLHTYIYLPNLCHKKLLLQTMCSELLKFRLTQLILENYCDQALPCCDTFPESLQIIKQCYYECLPPRNLLTPPTTPQSLDGDNGDDSHIQVWFSPVSCEELVMLLFFLTQSYLRCSRKKSCAALRRRATYCTHDMFTLPPIQEELSKLPEYTEELHRHILDFTSELTPATDLYLKLMKCLACQK